MFQKIFNFLKKTKLKVLKESKITINGYFGYTDYSTTLIKYKGKKINYPKLKRYLFKYMNFENDPKLIMQMMNLYR